MPGRRRRWVFTLCFPQRRHLPLRVRLFIDLLKETYGRPSYWELR
jgi:DNA-binding transcriptional LysR family regulator